MSWLLRTAVFMRFTLREYVRSGRILVELLTALLVAWVFFWPNGSQLSMDPVWFFGMGGIYLGLLTGYTTLTVLGLGTRPQGYLLLSRDLGRSGYLSGLYAVALLVVCLTYLLFSALLALAWAGLTSNFDLGVWLLGSLPLLLNVAVVAAFLTLIAPLVMGTRLRLVVLGLVMLALARNLSLFGTLPGQALFAPVEALLGLPLLPVLGGYSLSVRSDLTLLDGAVTFLAQLLLATALLGAAVWFFVRRELILAS